MLDQILNAFPMEHNEPVLKITEQPKPKDHRFRYPCEGRTAGALLGVSSTQKKKTCPEVKVQYNKEGVCQWGGGLVKEMYLYLQGSVKLHVNLKLQK